MTTFAHIDHALAENEHDLVIRARQAALVRAARIAKADPVFYALVLHTDPTDQTPIADPSAPDLCENR